jgi:hypothetical protein
LRFATISTAELHRIRARHHQYVGRTGGVSSQLASFTRTLPQSQLGADLRAAVDSATILACRLVAGCGSRPYIRRPSWGSPGINRVLTSTRFGREPPLSWILSQCDFLVVVINRSVQVAGECRGWVVVSTVGSVEGIDNRAGAIARRSNTAAADPPPAVVVFLRFINPGKKYLNRFTVASA